MIDSQLFMGGAAAALCLVSLRFDQWFVDETRKGKWLANRFGRTKSIWIWRSMSLLGFVFGVCLACRWINPMN